MRFNGCHNHEPYQDAMWVQDGWMVHQERGAVSKVPRMVYVPFKMEPKCQYTLTELGKVDESCNGCKHKETP